MLRQIQLKIAKHKLNKEEEKYVSPVAKISDVASNKARSSVISSTKSVGIKEKKPKDPTQSYMTKIQDQEDTISELKQTIMLMETKMRKYEEMLAIKENQIQQMKGIMEQAGLL